jgi:23S rRNA (cytosine1962-C5)-methyltransferase
VPKAIAEEAMTERPEIILKRGEERRIVAGHPWIYSNELVFDAAAKAIPPGSVVLIKQADGRPFGLGFFNPKPLIAGRLLTRDHGTEIDARFWQRRLERALKLRDRLIGVPFYRLAHAEADGFPGCVIDRYGDVAVIEISSAGMDGQLEALAEALTRTFKPRAILARGEGPAREMEGLEPLSRSVLGAIDEPVEIVENAAKFLAEPGAGQKTGWFFDQRDNRALVARLAKGGRVLDAYCYMGGFAIQALLAGAARATGIDRSESALALARKAAALNQVESGLDLRQGEAFETLAKLQESQERFDIVVADPPAFVKSRKDFHQGARAYRKLARLAAACVECQGMLMLCSCSHHMPVDELLKQAARGINEAGRSARLLYQTGAAPDHPIHPALPESAYLKALTFALD